jgi:hypothetical protein
MFKAVSDTNAVYIVAFTDDQGNVTGFPMGGGSSTKPSIKAHETYKSAKRSANYFPKAVVVRATGFEVVEE